jgi:hypothetical protein
LEADPDCKQNKTKQNKEGFVDDLSSYAAFDAVNTGVAQAVQQSRSNLVGIGLTPEAIDTNPIIYDFMMEFSWTAEQRDVDAWVGQWAQRRYGLAAPNALAAKYWAALRAEILNCNTGQMAATASPLVMRPNLYVPSGVGCCATTQQYYSPAKLDRAWSQLLAARGELRNTDTYKNDLVEITRQVRATILCCSDCLLLVGLLGVGRLFLCCVLANDCCLQLFRRRGLSCAERVFPGAVRGSGRGAGDAAGLSPGALDAQRRAVGRDAPRERAAAQRSPAAGDHLGTRHNEQRTPRIRLQALGRTRQGVKNKQKDKERAIL